MNLTEILTALEQYALQNRVPIINKVAGNLLVKTVEEKQPVSILEIGTAIGYSALLMCSKMPPDGKIVTIEKDKLRAAVAKDYISRAKKADRIQIICGDAADILDKLSGRYDMVFIDAAKGQYLNYLLKIINKLNPEAVIVADNVLFRGMVREDKSPRRYRTIVKRLREYLDFMTTDPRFVTSIREVGDGLAISYYQGEKKV